jgi:peptidoglycan LD-endopeptidase LytH
MRAGTVILSVAIGVFIIGCEPQPPLPPANSNSNVNAPANSDSSTAANAKANANANANAGDWPINYATPAASANPAQSPTPALLSQETEIVAVPPLLIPVQGVRKEDLRDTFNDARSEGRSHDAIDIMAPAGTPVLAVADGEIAQFHDSERGGITIYQYSQDKKLIYYYAHLQSRAPNLKPKDFVRQGTVIGYVGDTGNSGAGNFHLHFAVWAINDPQRVWEGTNINPYPLLTRGAR